MTHECVAIKNERRVGLGAVPGQNIRVGEQPWEGWSRVGRTSVSALHGKVNSPLTVVAKIRDV